MTKGLTQQAARNAISKELGKRVRYNDGKAIFLKKLIFSENVWPNLPFLASTLKRFLVQKFNIKAFQS